MSNLIPVGGMKPTIWTQKKNYQAGLPEYEYEQEYIYQKNRYVYCIVDTCF